MQLQLLQLLHSLTTFSLSTIWNLTRHLINYLKIQKINRNKNNYPYYFLLVPIHQNPRIHYVCFNLNLPLNIQNPSLRYSWRLHTSVPPLSISCIITSFWFSSHLTMHSFITSIVLNLTNFPVLDYIKPDPPILERLIPKLKPMTHHFTCT